MTQVGKDIPPYVKFSIAALSGVGATMLAYPFELLKNRMQMSGEAGQAKDHGNVVEFAKAIMKLEGPLGFYSGFSASALRQVLYTGVRMGSFQSLIDYLTVDGKPPSILMKLGVGVLTGAMGAISGLPADVAMIRMAVDMREPPERRRNYKHVGDALARIIREEGYAVLFRGFTPTVARAIVINTSQVVTYMQCKEFVLQKKWMEDNVGLHIVCSVTSAFAATVCSLPLDIAKTRIQNMRVVNGKPQYGGILNVWYIIVTKEGFFSLWKGFTPYFIKNGPQTVAFFIIYEKLFNLYNKYA